MRPALVSLVLLALGCGSSSSGAPDAGGGGDGDGGGGSGDGDGGGTSGPRTVSLTLNNRPNNGTQFSFLVAYQDGGAGWQLAPVPTGDTYAFEINAPSYGVAFACIGNVQTGGGGTSIVRSVTSAHFAVSERTSVTLDVPSRCSDRQGGSVTLSGNVSNRPFSGVLVVQYGSRSAFVGSQSGNFTLQTPPGTRDLIVSHAVPTGNGDFYIDETVVVRDLAVTANTMQQIDFSEAAETEYLDVDVPTTNARVTAGTTLYTANGTTASLTRRTSSWESDVLAASQRRATDIYDQSITVSSFGRGVTLTQASSSPGAQTFVAPAAFGDVSASIAAQQPYVVLDTEWPAYADAIGYTWSATQQGPCNNNSTQGCATVWTASLSPGVTGAMPAYRMPDLSGLTGWKADFELDGNSPIVGNVTAVTSSAGATDFPTGIPADGTQRAFVRTDYGLNQ